MLSVLISYLVLIFLVNYFKTRPIIIFWRQQNRKLYLKNQILEAKISLLRSQEILLKKSSKASQALDRLAEELKIER